MRPALMVLLSFALLAQAPRQPRFESDIVPVLRARCLACHGEGAPKGGLDLRSRDSALRGGEAGAAVIPGKSAESLLYRKVVSGQMPLGGMKLPANEIDLIARWIDGGALRDGEDAVAARPRASEREVMVTILHVKCLVCHGRQVQEAGLDLRTRASLVAGGKSGPAMVPGKPEESLLLSKIGAGHPSPDLQNDYFVRPVTSDELEKLRDWISAGAPADEDEALEPGEGPDPLVREQDRKFWAFQPPRRPPAPRVKNEKLVRNPIDAFLLEKLEARGLSFSAPAERMALFRRAAFDLTGLPPDPVEVRAYLEDRRADAYERWIDRLLASPQYGERWARFWLDAAGYADSEGGGGDSVRPHAWRYRDYVIRAFNADKPYDRFLLEQIAGDELFDWKQPRLSLPGPKGAPAEKRPAPRLRNGQSSFDGDAVREPTPEQVDWLTATGFLRMTPDRTHEHDANFVPTRLEVLANQVEMLASNVMGLTMGCARCHSHKFDPIPHRDYYRFSAILRAAYDPYDWLIPNRLVGGNQKRQPPERHLAIVPERDRQEVAKYNAPIQAEVAQLEKSLEALARPLREKLREERLAQLPEGIRADLRRAIAVPGEKRSALEQYLATKFRAQVDIGIKDLQERFDDFRAPSDKLQKSIAEAKQRLRPEAQIRALFDMGGEPMPTRILLRGDPALPAARVNPGVPSVLRDGIEPYRVAKPAWTTGATGRRLALARWLTQPNHPLTARVMVNRIWQDHFGAGIVSTPGNFGRTGALPTHPELLDWLATEFVRQKWSLKAMHRLLMTSAAYRQSSVFDPAVLKADPDNSLLSRFLVRRMEAEVVRDSVLKVTGRLDPRPFGPPEGVEMTPEGEVVSKAADTSCAGGVCEVPAFRSATRRSIYTLQRRDAPVTLLEVFDAPYLEPNSLKRGYSTVPTQALQLMNGAFVRESARHFAGRIIDKVGPDLAKQVEQAYLTAFSRPPDAEETRLGIEMIRQATSHWREHLDREARAEPRRSQAEWLALASFCHTLLNSPGFAYID